MNKGFTLLELLIVLAIISILTVIGLPNYRSFIQNQRADTAIQQLYYEIQTAKSEAIRRNQFVTICPSTDGKRCGKDWSKGVLLFVDLDESGVLSSDDELIRFFKPTDENGILTFNSLQKKQVLQITPIGITNYQTGRFDYSVKNTEISRSLIISALGRMRVQKTEDRKRCLIKIFYF